MCKLAAGNQKILNLGIKSVKFWAKMADFGQFGQNGRNGNFFKKKRLEHFLRLQALTNSKVSEKIMNSFRETVSLTNKRTNGRT